MFLKSGPLVRRYRWWRRGYTSRRKRVWRLGRGHVGGVDADLTPSLAPKILAPRWCFNPALNLPARAFFLFFLLPLGSFLSPLRPTSRIGILDLGNFDLIRRSSRARYPRSLLVFFQVDSVYISQIFQLKNHHYLGFHAILIFILYNRRMSRRRTLYHPYA